MPKKLLPIEEKYNKLLKLIKVSKNNYRHDYNIGSQRVLENISGFEILEKKLQSAEKKLSRIEFSFIIDFAQKSTWDGFYSAGYCPSYVSYQIDKIASLTKQEERIKYINSLI
ncbi:MAG: hypothetical protein Q7S27_04460 [Nanoarchaeota archaeon]|nr:hypothetical protein [Nanoarchaeota archaeon]